MFLVLLAVFGCTRSEPDTAVPPTIDQPIELAATAPAATPVPKPKPTAPPPATATSVPEPTISSTLESTATPEPFQEDLFLQLVNPPGK